LRDRAIFIWRAAAEVLFFLLFKESREKPMCKKFHVAKSSNSEGWIVREGRQVRPKGTFKVKSEAVKAAKKLGQDAGGFVIILNSDGKVSEVRRYKSPNTTERVRVQSAPVKSRLSKQDIYKAIATVEMNAAG
jgi:hypothetical protein